LLRRLPSRQGGIGILLAMTAMIMKIVICGSNAFRKEMLEYVNKLRELGHEGIIHPDYEAFAKGEKQDVWQDIQKEHWAAKRKYNYIKWYYNAIVNSDAILVLNFNKKGIKNYIGGNTLMEIGFAHVNDKKVFLMNPIPEEVSYFDEIKAMVDEIIDNDLNKINI